MNNRMKKLSLLSGVLAASLLAACGGGGSGSADAQYGSLSVSMTDAPACGFDEVNVTVNKVRVHQSADASAGGGGWADIEVSPARKINLLDLTNGALEDLGQTTLPVGHYTQLRLMLDSNTGNNMANSVVVSATGQELALATPSGIQSGIKVVGGFDVATDQLTSLVLDFDACKSVVEKGVGGYALKPVIKFVPSVPNGIDGYIATALLDDNVMVSAQQNGNIISATVPDPQTGKFFLSRLPLGNYDVVITADGNAPSVVSSVPVTSETATVALSTSDAPIDLEAAVNPEASVSGTVTLSPAPAEETPVHVAAKQSFSAGPTVTIKYVGANLADGTYILAGLPTVAPKIGQFSTTLPITFAADVGVMPGVGRYTMEANASGYQMQSATADVSAANATDVDFTLAP
jgi:hypothetical protein